MKWEILGARGMKIGPCLNRQPTVLMVREINLLLGMY